MAKTTFRDLVDAARSKGRAKGQRPASVEETVKMLGISKSYLYLLMAGEYQPPFYRIERLAMKLGVSEKVVRDALLASREEMMTS